MRRSAWAKLMLGEVTISRRPESVIRPVSVARETTVLRVKWDSGDVW